LPLRFSTFSSLVAGELFLECSGDELIRCLMPGFRMIAKIQLHKALYGHHGSAAARMITRNRIGYMVSPSD
jgi:hypothetical protein